MSTSIFLQGMSGDPLSLPPEYQDLVTQMNVESHHEDSGSEGTLYCYFQIIFMFNAQMKVT